MEREDSRWPDLKILLERAEKQAVTIHKSSSYYIGLISLFLILWSSSRTSCNVTSSGLYSQTSPNKHQFLLYFSCGFVLLFSHLFSRLNIYSVPAILTRGVQKNSGAVLSNEKIGNFKKEMPVSSHYDGSSC